VGEESEVEVYCESSTTDNRDFCFSSIYLLDVMNSANSDVIIMQFTESHLLITREDDEHTKFVVMPMRI